MSTGILDGIRIIDLGTVFAAPMSGSLLSDFGADVIKIEQPSGDPARGMSTQIWKVLNRNKKHITLDFHSAEGAEILYGLVKDADIVVTNFRPQALKKFRIDYEDLAKVKSDIIMLHFSAYGRTGPYSEKPGFARVSEGFAGLTHFTGFPDGDPVFSGTWIADGLGGVYSAFSIMLALYHRKMTGEGQLIDLSLYEPLMKIMEDYIVDYDILGKVKGRIGNDSPVSAPNNLFKCKDGSYVIIPCNTQQIWERLAVAMGRADYITDDRFRTNADRIRNKTEIENLVRDWTGARERREIFSALEDGQVAYGPVNSVADIFDDPHIAARENLVKVFDPVLGRKITMQGVVPRLSRTPGAIRWPGRDIGADNDEIYLGKLGLDPARYAELKAKGVI